jgi:hypothetical protein
MAQERLAAVRRMLALAPLPVKILLVAALLLLGVFTLPFLIVAAFIYAPIAVFAGHRSLAASLAVAVWGLAVVSGFSGSYRTAVAPLMLLPFAMVAGAHARPLSRQFVPCRTVVLALLWALPPAMVAWHLLPSQPLASIIIGWVLGGLVLAWRWAKASQAARGFGRQQARGGALAAPRDWSGRAGTGQARRPTVR